MKLHSFTSPTRLLVVYHCGSTAGSCGIEGRAHVEVDYAIHLPWSFTGEQNRLLLEALRSSFQYLASNGLDKIASNYKQSVK